MKKQISLIATLFFLFMVVGVSLVSAVECNATSVEDGGIINSSSISDGCTLSSAGTYYMSGETFYLNGSTDGAIQFASSGGITLEGNNSVIIGNNSLNMRGIRSGGRSNIIIKDIKIRDYDRSLEFITATNISFYNSSITNSSIALRIVGLSNSTISNITFFNSSLYDIEFNSGDFYSVSIINSLFSNTTSQYSIRSAPNLNINYINITGNTFLRRIATMPNLNNSYIEDNILSSSFYSDLDYILYLTNNTNTYLRNNNFSNYRGSLSFTGKGTGYIEMTGNRFNNCSGYECVQIFNAESTSTKNISNNYLNLSDRTLYIFGSSNIWVFNNTIENSYTSFDGYGSSSHILNSQNVTFDSNIFNKSGSWCLSMVKVTDIDIINNYCDILSKDESINYSIIDYGEPRGAFGIFELYKSWNGDGTNAEGDNRTNKIAGFNSSDVNVSGNTYSSNVEVYFINRGGISNIVNEDLSGLSTWFRSYQFDYWEDKSDLWINNNFNNLSSKLTSGTIGIILQQNFRNINKFNFTITKDYDYIIHTNETTYDNLYKIYNLTNALIYNTNNSIYGNSDISLNDGNINITLPPNNASYVLDNFNLTENIARENSPLWFSSLTGTEKHIASNLSNSINATVIINVTSCSVNRIYYTSNTTKYNKTYTGSENNGDWYCIRNDYIVVNISNIEPSTNSNVIQIFYGSEGVSSSGGADNTGLISKIIDIIGNYTKNTTILDQERKIASDDNITKDDNNLNWELFLAYLLLSFILLIIIILFIVIINQT